MKQRKVLIAIAVVIFILLLLYWLFVAEDINAWLPVNSDLESFILNT